MPKLRVGLAQLDFTVGDLDGNTAKILNSIDEAKALGVDLVAFPELAITGYPPEDLLLRPRFVSDNLRKLALIAERCREIAAVIGFVDGDGTRYNAAAVIHNGKLAGTYRKLHLPSYGVFDEKRHFAPGSECPLFTVSGVRVGISICEDIWEAEGPAVWQAYHGAEVLVNISASPFHAGKRSSREEMLATRACEGVAIACYVNLVGGQDELIFDGGSIIFDQHGQLLARAKQFEEDMLVADLDVDAVARTRREPTRELKETSPPGQEGCPVTHIVLSDKASAARKQPLLPAKNMPLDPLAEIYAALVLGIRDYVRKSGFENAVVGLSGGIDSALTATIAADALGADNVIGVSLPSQHSSPGSKDDARLLADNLGIRLITIPITETFQTSLAALAEPFAEAKPDVTEENLQARIRCNILMALSNKFGWLMLGAGNKSETACGYTTIYGDMSGGFSVLKDVPKTMVYRLARHRNSGAPKPVIPESIILKEPSAELRPGQRDTDTLPPYDTLDPILQAYVEEERDFDEIVALGFEPETVKRVMAMVNKNEYKRRQAPPGVKITPRAFGKDRRMPIVNRYRPFPG